MVNTKPLTFITNRTAAELDDKCGMAHWWNQYEGGRGMVPKEEALALAIGRETHEDLSTIALLKDISEDALKEIVADSLLNLTSSMREDTVKMEMVYRRLGWMVAFAMFIEPNLREHYDNVMVEGELVLERPNFRVAVTPDRVLKSKKNGMLIYKEYKSAKRTDSKWMASWLYAIQLHIGLAAIQEEFPHEKIAFGQIMGLIKGNYSFSEDHRLVHPYVWGWYNDTHNKWETRYESARSAGWRAMPVWEYPGGLVEWVKLCGVETARGQFPHSVPVHLNSIMLEKWIARRRHREVEIDSVKERCKTDLNFRALYFPQHQSQCRPAWGDACPYQLACWNATVELNPLAHPNYIPRTPHHELELIGWED